MKVLLMPNSLKGSLSAGGFCKVAAAEFKNKVSLKAVPVSDGGDGLIDVFMAAYPACRKYNVTVMDAVYRKHKAPYLILPDNKTCVIETAKVCGLGVLKKSDLNPLGATSFGIGQVIKAAAKKGAKTFYVGLGGVACNDAGAGMAAALGFELLDSDGNAVALGVFGLLSLRQISAAPKWLKSLKFIGLSDVKNPLLGPLGSAAVYGPQKGATAKDIKVMESALTNYAKIVKRDLKVNVNTPRCGAAGAIAAGLKGFLHAELADGGKFVLEKLGAADAVKEADLLIAAEGKLDMQTFYGKAPQEVCKLAARYKKPVIFICGTNEIKDMKLLKKHSIIKVAELLPYAESLEDAKLNAAKYLKQIINTIIKDIAL